MTSRFSFNSNLLSKHRNSLYGFAAIMILCVHSCGFWEQKSAISKMAFSLFQYGSPGVPIFGLLGGVGLYYSLIKHPKLSIFYMKRVKRVFLPFFCIALIWYAYEYLISDFDIVSFFYEISTIGFWIRHSSMWYIAMLVPVYAFSPFYSRWVERGGKRGLKTIAAITCVFLMMVSTYHLDPSLHQHLHLVFRTLALILCGYYLGGKVIKNEKLSILWVITPVIIFVAYKLILNRMHLAEYEPLWSLSFAFFALPLAIVLSMLFDHMGTKIAALNSLGAVSLESYVWNQILIKLQQEISLKSSFCASHQILIYILLVPVGILLSYITYWVLQRERVKA